MPFEWYTEILPASVTVMISGDPLSSKSEKTIPPSIFPSWVMHGVPPNPKQKMRKCLGINALTKGKLGDTHTISGIDYGRYINE